MGAPPRRRDIHQITTGSRRTTGTPLLKQESSLHAVQAQVAGLDFSHEDVRAQRLSYSEDLLGGPFREHRQLLTSRTRHGPACGRPHLLEKQRSAHRLSRDQVFFSRRIITMSVVCY